MDRNVVLGRQARDEVRDVGRNDQGERIRILGSVAIPMLHDATPQGDLTGLPTPSLGLLAPGAGESSGKMCGAQESSSLL